LLSDGSCQAADLRLGLLGFGRQFATLSAVRVLAPSTATPTFSVAGFRFEFGQQSTADPNRGLVHQKRSWKAKHRLN